MENNNQPAFVISLDFELYWGVRDVISLDRYESTLSKIRTVVPSILELFQKYGIHATWATVGFMFFLSKTDLLNNLPVQKPDYFNRILSPYTDIDKICDGEERDPYHFAPSLIKKIIATPHQEIASHTFSHYYCLEKGQTDEDFRADMLAAIKTAGLYGCRINSLVFPRNQYSPSHLKICDELGISAYRGNEKSWFYETKERIVSRQLLRRFFRLADAYINISGANDYPYPKPTSFPVNLPSSRYLRPYTRNLFFLENLRFDRIVLAMKTAAKNGRLFHLWWHPEGFCKNTEKNLRFLEEILLFYKSLEGEYGMLSLNMGEIANSVNGMA